MPRWPASTTQVAEGTFEEGVKPSGANRYEGTITVPAAGIEIASLGPPSFTDGVRFNAGTTLTTGFLDYSMRLAAGSDVSGGGFIAVIFVEEGTNILLAAGDDHFLSGTTPGSTVFTGQIDMGGPYTFTSNHWLAITVGAFDDVGVDQTHWEVEVG